MPGEISRSNPGGDGSIPWHVLSPDDQREAGKGAYFMLHEWRMCGHTKNHKEQQEWLHRFTERVEILLGMREETTDDKRGLGRGGGRTMSNKIGEFDGKDCPDCKAPKSVSFYGTADGKDLYKCLNPECRMWWKEKKAKPVDGIRFEHAS